MLGLVGELFPLPRSLTGDGVRRTLAAVGRHVPLDVVEVPSGTPVLDWTVPREWSVRGAWITGPDGRRVVDAFDSSLHLVGYSIPFRGTLELDALLPHLHSLPDQPDLVPYRTSYWREDWGFCLSHRVVEALAPGGYEVVVDTALEDGALTYGEVVLPGLTDDEILVTAHTCHPALANDNLSGIAVAAFLGARLAARRLRHTVRLLFAPGTIGAITWLAHNREGLDRIRAGVVLAGVGDAGGLTWKRSRRGDTVVDAAVEHVLAVRGAAAGETWAVEDFSPWGYDERQFCSPGFDLPVGRLSRTPHGTYPQYHTSADDLSFVSPGALLGALDALTEVVEAIDGDARYRNLAPHGEPQLGRRGLYRAVGGQARQGELELALLWVLNLSDATHTLLDAARRARLPFGVIRAAADLLLDAGLLAEVEQPT